MILLVLIALAARVDAAPVPADDDPIALAVRYANILTGFDPDADLAATGAVPPDDPLAGHDDGDDDDDGDRNSDDHGRAPAGDEARDRASNDPALGLGASPDDELGFASRSAGASESYEARLRSHTSIVGRLDLGLAWRRRWSDPMHAPSHRGDEIWLLATWRR